MSSGSETSEKPSDARKEKETATKTRWKSGRRARRTRRKEGVGSEAASSSPIPSLRRSLQRAYHIETRSEKRRRGVKRGKKKTSPEGEEPFGKAAAIDRAGNYMQTKRASKRHDEQDDEVAVEK